MSKVFHTAHRMALFRQFKSKSTVRRPAAASGSGPLLFGRCLFLLDNEEDSPVFVVVQIVLNQIHGGLIDIEVLQQYSAPNLFGIQMLSRPSRNALSIGASVPPHIV